MAEMNARERFNLRTRAGNPRGRERETPLGHSAGGNQIINRGRHQNPSQEDKYLSATFVVEDEAAPSQQSHTRGPLTYGLCGED